MKRLEVSFADGRVIYVQLTVMEKCFHVWLGSGETPRNLNNVVQAIQTKFDPMPLTRPIVSTDSQDVQVGVTNDEWASILSQRLAKRLKQVVLVSCSLPPKFDELLSSVEQQIVTYFENTVVV